MLLLLVVVVVFCGSISSAVKKCLLAESASILGFSSLMAYLFGFTEEAIHFTALASTSFFFFAYNIKANENDEDEKEEINTTHGSP